MIEKLQTAESALESLQRDLARIEEDLGVKINSLALDNKCMEIRKKLTDPDFIPDQSLDEVTDRVSKLSAKEMERISPVQDVVDYDTTEYKINESLGRNNQNMTNVKEAEVMIGQNSKISSRNKDRSMLETTYNASYQIDNSNLRSGDLARTLGQSQERYSATRGKRDILID